MTARRASRALRGGSGPADRPRAYALRSGSDGGLDSAELPRADALRSASDGDLDSAELPRAHAARSDLDRGLSSAELPRAPRSGSDCSLGSADLFRAHAPRSGTDLAGGLAARRAARGARERRGLRFLLAAAGLALAACAPLEAKVYGEQLFNDAAFAGSKFNAFSCATCHATRAGDTRLLPGMPLPGVTARSAYWGGAEESLLAAVNFCLVQFQRAPAPLTEDDVRGRALFAYLKSLEPAGASTAPLPYPITRALKDLPNGDATRGEAVYAAACKSCHGAAHTGEGRLTERAQVLPEVDQEYPSLFPGTPGRLVFLEKIRHGKFFGVGGEMPLYGTGQLSDDDVSALFAFFSLGSTAAP
jgi:thiosulfate dehydrogenase